MMPKLYWTCGTLQSNTDTALYCSLWQGFKCEAPLQLVFGWTIGIWNSTLFVNPHVSWSETTDKRVLTKEYTLGPAKKPKIAGLAPTAAALWCPNGRSGRFSANRSPAEFEWQTILLLPLLLKMACHVWPELHKLQYFIVPNLKLIHFVPLHILGIHLQIFFTRESKHAFQTKLCTTCHPVCTEETDVHRRNNTCGKHKCARKKRGLCM